MNTKTILVEEAVPGMIVAEDVYGLQDYLIIPAHSELTNHTITRLKFYAIPQIIIEVNEAGEPETTTDDLLMAETYTEYIESTPEFKKFDSSFQSVVEDFKAQINTINGRLKEPLDTPAMLRDMENVFINTRNCTHIVHLLQCLKDSDDVIYTHSIHVAVLANVIGRWLKFSENDLQTLTLAGMLHDIGKTTIPSAIIYKPSRLTNAEFEIIKAHTQNGYNLLIDQHLNSHILNATLMHHERVDGSGYPRGLKGDQIDDYAQIIAIADVYIAMTNPRAYRRANCPFDALRVLEQDGYEKFKPSILVPFLEGMANTFINATVRLSNDQVGEIVMIDGHHVTHPVVKVGNGFIDLEKERSIHIQDIL